MTIFTEKELATELGVSPWTVRTWRMKAGLPYFGTSKRIFYRLDAVKAWMEAAERQNTEQQARKPAPIIC